MTIRIYNKAESKALKRPKAVLKRVQRGFTVLELMIVSAIFALVLAIGGPSMTKMISRNTLQQVNSDISLGLLYARSEAVKRNMESRLYIFSSNAWGIYLYDGATYRLLEYNYLPDRVQLTGPYYTSFSGNGRATPYGGVKLYEMEMENSDTPKRCIYITAAGVGRTLIDNDQDGICTNG